MSVDLSYFTLPRSKLQVGLDRYQYLLSIVATFWFFSEIPDYLGDGSKLIPLNILAWLGIFSFLALPFVKKIATMPKPLVIAMSIYLVISLLSLATVSSDEPSLQEFRNRILSVWFMCLMHIIYDQKSLKQVKYALLAAVLMAVANNFYELLNPGVFSPLNVGRPAGFYVNPNKTGCALMLGMILSINVLKKPYRWLYVAVVAIGLLWTFTRGAIVGWVICVALFIAGRVLSDKRRNVILPALLLVSFLVIANPLKLATDYFQGDTNGSYYNVLERLEQFQNPSVEDSSAQDRGSVAKYGWQMFGRHPFWGNGLGSTNKWTVAPFSTHNMYLYYMADHGVIGFLFLPGAIFAVVYRNRGEDPIIILSYAIFVGMWGMFSHNVLEERYILTTFALMAAMSTSQNWQLKYPTRNFQLALPPARAQFYLPPATATRGYVQRALPPAANSSESLSDRLK